LVKYALVSNSTGSSQSYSVQAKTGSDPTRQLFAGTVANGATFILPQPFTLNAGDVLTVSGGSAALVVMASGIEFTP
jgi:hypothetical protein